MTRLAEAIFSLLSFQRTNETRDPEHSRTSAESEPSSRRQVVPGGMSLDLGVVPQPRLDIGHLAQRVRLRHNR